MNIIGAMTWESCKNCRYSEDRDGNTACNAHEDEFIDELEYDGDFLFCGHFEHWGEVDK